MSGRTVWMIAAAARTCGLRGAPALSRASSLAVLSSKMLNVASRTLVAAGSIFAFSRDGQPASSARLSSRRGRRQG
jgi:hypothetical protein